MKLTAKYLQSITKPGRYYDDAAPGLFVLAQSHTRKRDGETMIRLSFVQRVTVNGKRVDLGLGSPKWGAVTLTEARAKAIANYRIARNGGDPRQGAKPVPTFADGLDAVLAIQAPTWRNPKSEPQWRASLRDYAGALMAKPVDRIGPADVLAVVGPIWNAKRETARRVKQRIGRVMEWAVAEGLRTDNPVSAIAAALPKNGHGRKHHRAVAYAAVSGALASVRDSGAWWATKAAFEFLTLTAARSGEVRGMRWSEVDGDVWTVPGERMKAGRAHRVPLSPRALAILDEAREATDGDGLVFPSITGRAMSDSTLSKLVKELGIDGTPHGMRSAFRDWASERTSTPHAVMEAALAHTIPNKAEAAYARSDLLDKRRQLMDTWARYLDGERAAVLHMAG